MPRGRRSCGPRSGSGGRRRTVRNRWWSRWRRCPCISCRSPSPAASRPGPSSPRARRWRRLPPDCRRRCPASPGDRRRRHLELSFLQHLADLLVVGGGGEIACATADGARSSPESCSSAPAGIPPAPSVASFRPLIAASRSRRTARNDRIPVAIFWLAIQPHRRIPRSVAPPQQPAPVRREGQHQPDGPCQRAGEMRRGRIDADQQSRIPPAARRCRQSRAARCQASAGSASPSMPRRRCRAARAAAARIRVSGAAKMGDSRDSGMERRRSCGCAGRPEHTMPMRRACGGPSHSRHCARRSAGTVAYGTAAGTVSECRCKVSRQAQQRTGDVAIFRRLVQTGDAGNAGQLGKHRPQVRGQFQHHACRMLCQQRRRSGRTG